MMEVEDSFLKHSLQHRPEIDFEVISILSKLEDHSYFFTQIKSEARAGGPFDKVKVQDNCSVVNETICLMHNSLN